MTPFPKSFRSTMVLSLFLTVAFVQNTSAQTDTRYQYQQRSNGAPTNSATSTPPMATADRKITPLAPTQSVPFDGGLSLFVLAGAGIAAKKRYDKRKAKA